jgi:hypothetical protein
VPKQGKLTLLHDVYFKMSEIIIRKITMTVKCRNTFLRMCFGILFALAIFNVSGVAAAVRNAPPAKLEQDYVSKELESFDRWRKALSEERLTLEKQVDRQYAAFNNLVTTGAALFSFLAAAALGYFFWTYGKSKDEFKKTIASTFKQQVQEICEEQAEQLKSRYENLKSEVEDLVSYKKSQITWVMKPDADRPDAVLRALHAVGLQRVSTINPEAGQSFEIGNPDLVILTFDESDEAKRMLSVVVERLKEASPPVPLLIYTFSSDHKQVRLNAPELQTLSGFDWYVPVNFPAQLLAQTQLLIRRGRNPLGGNYGNV